MEDKKNVWRFLVLQDVEYEVVFNDDLTLEQAEREFLSGGYLYFSDIKHGKIMEIVCDIENEETE